MRGVRSETVKREWGQELEGSGVRGVRGEWVRSERGQA